MSKESAAAILVQTLFTTDTSMEHLMMSHAKIENADPVEIAKFIVPYYTAMLKAMDGHVVGKTVYFGRFHAPAP